MDTKILGYYTKIYETRSLHKAADELFISQQGLSRALQALENEYSTKFFERTSRGLIPTPAGDYFYEKACSLEKELIRMSSNIRNLSQGRAEIHIACSYGSMHLMYPAIRTFYKKHPNIWIHWAEYTDRDADQALRRAEAELAFVINRSDMHDFEVKKMASSRIMILVYEGHPLFDRDSLTLEDLRGEKIIAEGKQFHIYHLLQAACAARGFYPDIVAETAEINLCHTLCSMKEGLAIVVEFISDQLNLKNVRAIPLVESGISWEVMLARMTGETLSPAAEIFWNEI